MKMMNEFEIAKAVKYSRVKLGITQEELAKKSGISVATVNFLENGKIKPHPKTIVAVAEALGVNPKEWM